MRLTAASAPAAREGQSVPVGVGQPTLRIDGLYRGRHGLTTCDLGRGRAAIAVPQLPASHHQPFAPSIQNLCGAQPVPARAPRRKADEDTSRSVKAWRTMKQRQLREAWALVQCD